MTKSLVYHSEGEENFGPEIWKQSVSVPRLEVSSWGRIRITPYTTPTRTGKLRLIAPKTTYGFIDEVGNSRRYRYNPGNHTVARLVCEAFNGPPPFPNADCMHDDENPLNNRPENLKWGTRKENLNYPGFIAYCKNRTGENNPLVKGRRKKMELAQKATAGEILGEQIED